MTERDYLKYKMYSSFEDDIHHAKISIGKIPSQTFGGNSEVGYMQEELKEMKNELYEVLNKYRKIVKKYKEEL